MILVQFDVMTVIKDVYLVSFLFGVREGEISFILY